MRHLIVVVALLLAGCKQTAQIPLQWSEKLPENPAGAPVLILLHGYGSNEKDLFSLHAQLAPGFAVFSLRAPGAHPNGGFAWYPIRFLPDRQFEYDYQPAEESRKKILEFIAAVCRKHRLDSSRVFVLGFSQGGTMCYDLAFHEPARFRGVLPLSGRLLPESRQPLENNPQVHLSHFFIAHGLHDDVITHAEGREAYELLGNFRTASLRFRSYDTGHTISQEVIGDVRDWLVEHSR